MQIEKRYILGINADDADFAQGENDATNLLNIRVGTTDGGKTAWLENIPSTRAVANSLPTGTNTNIGATVDKARQRLLWFNHNSNGNHGIYAYDALTQSVYTVLLNSQVTGGLGFSTTFRINDARVHGDLLVWTDGNEDIKRINTEAGIKLNHGGYTTSVSAYTSPLLQSVITLIRNPPAFPVTGVKDSDVAVDTNFIKEEAFLFAYRYVYRDYEESVLSPWSRLFNYNYASETQNFIQLTISTDELIDQDVLRVDLVALFLNSNKAFIIKTWDKDNADDAAEIVNHNAGAALTYSFYNDKAPIALNDSYVVKPFDSVPVKCKTLEVARDRLLLGHVTKGYDSPQKSSLAFAVNTSGSSGLTKTAWDVQLVYRELDTGDYNYIRVWLVYLTETAPAGYYAVVVTENNDPSDTSMPSADSLPSTISTVGLSYRGLTQTDVVSYYDSLFVNYVPQFGSHVWDQPGDTTTITDISTGSFIPFKSDSAYQGAIVFYDEALRKCGVYTHDNFKVRIPDRNYALSSVESTIEWTLSNADAVNEIPDWAAYYQVVITKNLSTRNFVQGVSNEILYARKTTEGDFDIQAGYQTIAGASTHLAVSLDFLASYGMGYTFSENDIIKIYKSPGTVYTLSVVEQFGKYAICQLTDIGSTASQVYLFEIRTPYRGVIDEPFYENGQVFYITNAGTGTRAYNTLSGTINGDVYIRTRTHTAVDYYTEAMSPVDILWRQWNTDAGRVNLVDRIGQQTKIGSFVWSDPKIAGTKINGMSTFEALNESSVPSECGPLYKLQLTSKTQDDGTVLLAICMHETASIYLGEAQLVASAANSFIAKTDGFIGTMNVLKGSYGTTHPESVVEFRGSVYWFDYANEALIRYNVNGLFDVSNYKFKTTLQKIKKTAGSSAANLYQGGFDPVHNEYLLTANLNVPGSSLPGYVGLDDQFSVNNKFPKTLAFKDGADRLLSYSFTPERWQYIGSLLFSFKDGALYEHNDESQGCNSFYGTTYPSVIATNTIQAPGVVKVGLNVSVQANKKPDNVYLYTLEPNEQITDVQAAEFNTKEGVYYAPMFRDRLSPNVDGTEVEKMISGDELRSPVIKAMIVYTGNTVLNFKFLNIGYKISHGHTV